MFRLQVSLNLVCCSRIQLQVNLSTSNLTGIVKKNLPDSSVRCSLCTLYLLEHLPVLHYVISIYVHVSLHYLGENRNLESVQGVESEDLCLLGKTDPDMNQP